MRNAPVSTAMVATAATHFRLLVAQGKGELDGAAVVTLLPEAEEPSK